jgi:hypothetical protein
MEGGLEIWGYIKYPILLMIFPLGIWIIQPMVNNYITHIPEEPGR